MQWMENMKIGAKLLVSFIIMALLCGVVGIVGIINVQTLQQANVKNFETMTLPISEVGQISTSYQRMRVIVRDMIIENSPELIKSNADKVKIRNDEIDQAAAAFAATITDPDIQAVYDDFVASRQVLAQEFEKVRALAFENRDAEAFALMADSGSYEIAASVEMDLINQLVPMKLEAAHTTAAADQAAASKAITTMILVTILAFVVALVFGLVLRMLISTPLQKANQVISEMSKGHFNGRLKMDRADEIGQMAQSLDGFSDDLQNVLIGTITQLANGDLSAQIEAKDDHDELTPALKLIITTIQNLISETRGLADAAVAGQLQTRGNAAAFSGGYQEIITGINATLDTVIKPIHVATDYVQRIGQGEIPAKITETYPGDFNTLITAINACIDGLGALEEANLILAKLGKNDFGDKIEGDYLGIFGEMSASINNIRRKLDHIEDINNNIANGDMCDLEILSAKGSYGEKDKLIPSFINMLTNLKTLVDETNTFAECAVAGDLTYRSAAADALPGEYAKVIIGLNATLDAINAPINEAAGVLQELSQGHLDIGVTGTYHGDYNRIKDALNQTTTFLKSYVDEITSTLEAIGQGNLNLQINTDYRGDFQAIKTALNDITTNLSETMTEINMAAGQVDIGARQISDGGQALSQGTTEQASAIQQLTASIEEVAAETKRNASNANQANELAVNVRSNAEKGNSQMATMISAMENINDSSNNISKIIKVIDDIAFQTNILALNAAVEAARAGQHGKGFAVVAEEVRNLAARSAEAAKETTGLIEGSIEKVGVGTKIADETAESLKEILSQIDQVTGLVGTIARASNDQASEIAQITQGIEQVSQVVQTNSATAEESAAASEELSGQAEMLKNRVETFQLKTKNTKPASAPPPPRFALRRR